VAYITFLLLLQHSQPTISDLEQQIMDLEDRLEQLEARDPSIYIDDYISGSMTLADAMYVIQSTAGLCDLGCTVRLSPKTYVISNEITICRQVRLVGAGGYGPAAATLIESDGPVAIRVAFQDTCSQRGLGRDGRATTIEHIGFRNKRPAGQAAAGIMVEARTSIEHVWLRDYTHGIRVDAGVARTGGIDAGGIEVGGATNANISSIYAVRVDSSHHAGLYIDGPDANGVTILASDFNSNCRSRHVYDSIYGPCANVVEMSFLGNTYVGTHLATTNGAGIQLRTEGDANSRNSFVGTYMEGFSGNLGPNDTAFGGIGNWTGGGIEITDGVISSFCTRDDSGLGEMCVGERASGQLVQFRGLQSPFNFSRALRFGAAVNNSGEPWWLLQAQNWPGYRVGALHADTLEWDQESEAYLPECPAQGAAALSPEVGVLTSTTSFSGFVLCGFE